MEVEIEINTPITMLTNFATGIPPSLNLHVAYLLHITMATVIILTMYTRYIQDQRMCLSMPTIDNHNYTVKP